MTRPARRRPTAERIRFLNTRNLGTAVDLVNLENAYENAYENAEDGIVLRRVSVLVEMSRLAQREFPWQRGKVTVAALYRAARLYMFPLAEAFLKDRTGISMEGFCKVCFVLYAHFMRRAWLRPNETMKALGIADQTRDAGYRLSVGTFEQAAAMARNIRPVIAHPSYAQSVLRPKPTIVAADGVMVSPLVDLIMERCTSGLFYDLVSAGGEIRRKIGENFES